jgi:hypothetical protein
MNRWEQPFRGATALQGQINRVFGDLVGRTGEESNLTPWARAVDIYETENDLVVKADLGHQGRLPEWSADVEPSEARGSQA